MVSTVNQIQIEKKLLDSVPFENKSIARKKAKIAPVIKSLETPSFDRVGFWSFKIPTQVRLFFVMLDRWLSFSKANFLGSKIGLLSFLIYGIEIPYNLAKIAYLTFRSSDDPEIQKLNVWQRFKLACQKDGIISDLANAIIWFPVNLLTYFVFGPVISSLITIGALCFDCIHASGSTKFNINEAQESKRAHKRELIELESELKELLILQNNLNADMSEEIGHLTDEIEAEKMLYKKAKSQAEYVVGDRLYNLAMAGAILLFFAMSVLIPPTAPVAAFLVFLFGCVFSGLGKTIVENLWEWVKNKTEHATPQLHNDSGDEAINQPQYTHSYNSSAVQIITNRGEPIPQAQNLDAISQNGVNEESAPLLPQTTQSPAQGINSRLAFFHHDDEISSELGDELDYTNELRSQAVGKPSFPPTGRCQSS